MSAGQRFVVCHNPEAEERDRQVRANLVAYLESQIDGTDEWTKSKRDELAGRLRTTPALWRLVRRLNDGRFRIDKAAIAHEEKLDGKWLLRTSDDSLTPTDLAVAYKQLLEVERGWRDMKGSLGLRPVFHHREDRIRSHVQLCWLGAPSHPRNRERDRRHLAQRPPRARPDAPRDHGDRRRPGGPAHQLRPQVRPRSSPPSRSTSPAGSSISSFRPLPRNPRSQARVVTRPVCAVAAVLPGQHHFPGVSCAHHLRKSGQTDRLRRGRAPTSRTSAFDTPSVAHNHALARRTSPSRRGVRTSKPLQLSPLSTRHLQGHSRSHHRTPTTTDRYSSDTSPVYPIGGTLAKCDPFGTPSTSHWTGAAIIVQSPRTKTCIVTRSRTSTRPMPFSLAG